MTATMMDQVDARARAPEPTEGFAGAAFRLLPGRVVAFAWLLAGAPIAVLQLGHAGLHERNELPPLLHWLRDSSLAVPAAALAVGAAALVVTRVRQSADQRPSIAAAVAWGLLAAMLFAALSVPLVQAHGALFGAEEEAGVAPLEHALDEGIVVFQVALLLVPLSLLAGVPWRGAWRAAQADQVADQAPVQAPGSTRAAPAGPSASPATAGSTNVGGDR